MKWFIIVVLTINSDIPRDVINKPKFDTKELCREYVVKNYNELNRRMNKEHGQHHSTPNLFYCVNNNPSR